MTSRGRVGGQHFKALEAVLQQDVHGAAPVERGPALGDLIRWGYVIACGDKFAATPAGCSVFDTWQNLKDVST